MNIVLYLACVVVGVVGATDLFGSDAWGGRGLWSELRCCGLHIAAKHEGVADLGKLTIPKRDA